MMNCAAASPAYSGLPQIVRIRVVEEVEAQGQILPLKLGWKRRERARLVNAANGGAVQRRIAGGAHYLHGGNLSRL